MNIFTDYLQPLTAWVYANPSWALFITFLISFSESLAIVGSIIPGTVTMTAIGILAGSGLMRIDLTLIAATLGAVAGDSVSYALGYTFRHRLQNIWPFSRYPHWLAYGKNYFAKHGGKSVLIGRFIGPLRSIIPLIAGMMHMNRWHFLVSNVISAIGWSILYVMPGVLIGAASSELSAENASRLFILVLLLLVVAWILSIGIKWAIIRIHFFLKDKLHRFWLRLRLHPVFQKYAEYITPESETNHYATAALFILFTACLLTSIFICALVYQASFTAIINQPVHLFLQTLQTRYFDAFFIAVTLFIEPLSLLALFTSIAIYLVFHKDWRTLAYWLSLGITTAVILYILNHFIPVPLPDALPKTSKTLYFPANDMAFATSLFGFLIFYINTHYRTGVTLIIRVVLLALLLLSGIGTLYLANNWITGVSGAYCIGLTICLGHWIFYRRKTILTGRSQLPIVFSCLVLLAMTTIIYALYFDDLMRQHRPYHKQYVLTENAWWGQQKPILPIFTTNRIGHRTGVFNLQFIGNIKSFEQDLVNSGWKKQPSSFFFSLLERASGLNTEEELPLIAQLYQNQKPALVITYKAGKYQPTIILRLWRSNYHVQGYHEPIWLGSVHPHTNKRTNNSSIYLKKSNLMFELLYNSLEQFEFRKVHLKNKNTESLPHAVAPVIFLIKEQDKSP